MSAASIFKNIMEAKWAGVLAWKEEKAEESLHLEFKSKDREKPAELTDEDKGELAQAMSAFANSEGGVVVLGVHAIHQGKNFPDQVKSIVPLADVLSFKGAIQKIAHQLTDPPVPGILVEHIECPEKPTDGIVVIYVPQSDVGPHRAAKGPSRIADRYYMRSTLSSIPMHHTLLAEQFGRRPMPRLYLAVKCSISRTMFSAEVRIGNSGRGHAERPAVGFVQNPDPSQPEANPDIWWHLIKPAKGWDNFVLSAAAKDGVGCIVRAGVETVLYPGMEMMLGFVEDQRQSPRSAFVLSLHGKLYALNAAPAKFSLRRKLQVEASPLAGMTERIEIPTQGE